METQQEDTNRQPNNERIRYSFEKGQKKNTLSTVRIGNFIVFGISRCNPCDTFKKDIGKKIATARRDLMVDEVKFIDQDAEDLWFHESGLRGICHLARIKDLLQFFDNMRDYLVVETQTQEDETYELTND